MCEMVEGEDGTRKVKHQQGCLQWDDELFTVQVPIPTTIEYLEDVFVVRSRDPKLRASGAGETLREAELMFIAHIRFLVELFVIEGGELAGGARIARDRLKECIKLKQGSDECDDN